MDMNKLCKCPKCDSSGLSIAALNAKEIQEIKKDGTVNGVGIGLGTNGFSLLGGMGCYDEKGEIVTKRAKNFTMPLPEYVSNHLFLASGLMFVFSAIALPAIFSIRHIYSKFTYDEILRSQFLYVGQSFTDNSILYMILAMFVMSILGIIISYKTLDQNEKIENEEMPKLKARYRELHYCENCHLIYDAKGKQKNGDEIGFNQMMRIPADDENLLLFQEI
jgi:hypothetical protein